MADKVTNDAVAYVRGLAADRGRNVVWVEQAVRKSVSLTAQEAVKAHVVELVAPDTDALLRAVDGRRVTVLGRAVALHTKGAAIAPWPMNAPERLMHALANPTLALILLNLGVLGIVFELQNPTGFLAGIAGVIFLLLGLFALGMLPVNWVGVALVFFGLLLLVTELFVTSWGVLGAGGVLALVIGSVMMFQGPLPGLAPVWPAVLVVAVVSAAVLALGVSVGLKAQRRRPATGREELVGRVGVARSDLAPSGMVFLEGELWTAESVGEESVRTGDRVAVDRVDGLRLVVRKAPRNG
jgi:membrane-bound serine protease (ClpP class)